MSPHVTERLKIVVKKKKIVMADKTSATTNEQGRKRKTTKAIDLQSNLKGQRDVYFQRCFKELRFTKLIVQEHEVALRKPKYVVNELKQLEKEEQYLDWI
jgi:hypothetical protein